MISITKKRKIFWKTTRKIAVFFCSIKTFLFSNDPAGTPKKKQRCSYHEQRCFDNVIFISNQVFIPPHTWMVCPLT